MQLNNETTQTVFNAYEYERGLGQSNPIWEPVPEYYYPLDCKEIVYYTIFVFGIIGTTLGIFIGFLFWATQNTSKYVLTWSIVLSAFIIIALIFLWRGGKDRRRQEK
jgi:hypothetical protein